MEFTFTHQRRVEFSETDMAGIVHFSNFFRWMESAEHAFLRSLGHSVHQNAPEGTTGWPRLKVGCDFLKPLRFESSVDVVLSVKEVRSRSVSYSFEIRRSENGEVAAKGEVIAVHARVDTATGRLEATAIPEPLRSQLAERVVNPSISA